MDLRRKYQITEYCHHFLREYITEGDCCVDATCGNGNDTRFLCECAGPAGKVYAFDIQKCAVDATRRLLEEKGCLERAELICAGHEEMDRYVEREVSCIMFNFGYLPGGDHALGTKPETSLAAVEKGLGLLKVGGVMSLCIYSGGDTGYEERDALLAYLKDLDTKKWLVILNSFYNRRKDPPIPVFVIRLE